VTLVERSPIVAALVKDGIERASLNIEFTNIINTGFILHNQDALDYIQAIEDNDKPDVIYLDPMYPEKKKSASVKKNMQMLQKLLGHDLDTDEVLSAALLKADKRVVVKRPKGAPPQKHKFRCNFRYISPLTLLKFLTIAHYSSSFRRARGKINQKFNP